MKKILIGLTLLASMSSFASSNSFVGMPRISNSLTKLISHPSCEMDIYSKSVPKREIDKELRSEIINKGYILGESLTYYRFIEKADLVTAMSLADKKS